MTFLQNAVFSAAAAWLKDHFGSNLWRLKKRREPKFDDDNDVAGDGSNAAEAKSVK